MQESRKHTKAEIKKGIKAIWRHLSALRKEMVLLAVLGVFSALANGSLPYITGKFFDSLVNLARGSTDIGWSGFPVWMILLGTWAIIELGTTNIEWVMERARRTISNKFYFGFVYQAFSHFLFMPLSYHKTVHINGEMQKIGQASWRISATSRTLTDLAPQFLSVIIGLILAATINSMLAAVLVVGVVLYVLLLVRILLPVAEIDSQAHKSMNEAWDDAASAVLQIESVKQASAERQEAEKMHKTMLGRSYDLWQTLDRKWSNVAFFQRTIVFLTRLAVFVLSVRMISTGLVTVGELIALNGYAAMFFGPFVSLGYSWQNLQNGVTTAAHAEEIFEIKEESYIPQDMVDIGKLKGGVVFKDVVFKYEEDQPEGLKGIDLEVKPGQVVALVGESGVGKSTAIALISGYYFPTEGEVTIDGVNTRKLDLHNLRSQIAVVPQEVALFNDTIRANIAYGSFGASDEDVETVAKEAHIDEFIATLPEGYKTLVGERGIKLSVGQKQRVSIARAMLRDPAILILDEPTSALDAKTEKFVTEALEKLMKGRTTFIIAHRLSTVRKADKILVFEKGKIVETGTHEELVKKEKGKYRHFYEYQIGLH